MEGWNEYNREEGSLFKYLFMYHISSGIVYDESSLLHHCKLFLAAETINICENAPACLQSPPISHAITYFKHVQLAVNPVL